MLSGIQCLCDRIVADEEKHLIAKHSDLGWKLVSNMEGLEGQVGRISMILINLRAQESAFLKHKQAMDSVSKSGSGSSGAGASRYKPNPNNNYKGSKGKGKGKGKGGLNKTKEGRGFEAQEGRLPLLRGSAFCQGLS